MNGGAARNQGDRCQSAIETSYEEIATKEGAIPVGIERHDEIESHEAQDQRIENTEDRRKPHLSFPDEILAAPLSFSKRADALPRREIDEPYGHRTQKAYADPVTNEKERNAEPFFFPLHGLMNPRKEAFTAPIKDEEEKESNGQKSTEGLCWTFQRSPPPGMGEVQDGHKHHRTRGEAKPEDKIDEVSVPNPHGLRPMDTCDEGDRSD